MKEHIERRLEELKAEYGKGEEQLASAERSVKSIQYSMLRIDGAMEVLRELVETNQGPPTLIGEGE